MEKYRARKIFLFVFAFVLLVVVSFNLITKQELTTAGISQDGYKGLEKEKSIIYAEKRSKLRYLSFFIPKFIESRPLLRITYPKVFGEGHRRFTVKAKDGDLMLFRLRTTILEEKVTQEKKYRFPPELGFDIF